MMHAGEAVPAALYATRRARLAQAIGDGVAVLPNAPERTRSRDTFFPYRHDSHFYWLTGFTEPESVLVVEVAGGVPVRTTLFCRPRDPEREVWDGHRHGPEGARERYGFDEAHPIGDLDGRLPELLGDRRSLHTPIGLDTAWDARISGWLNAVRAKSRAGVSAPDTVVDVRTALDEMRLVKDAHELSLLRRAAAIAAAAHRRAMRATRPGMREYEVEAELLHEFRRAGAQSPAYTPIVAGGASACILHYVENDRALVDGTLLLVDAGCELDGYASDITRTFPVNGRYSGPQRELYELVLAAQAAAIAAVRPQAQWNAPHEAAVRVLAQGMIDLKLLDGPLDAALEKETYRRYYMHRTGHWLGMDVHDAGEYKRGGAWRPLEPNMVFTVEPGLYVRAGDDVPAAFHGIGIRIEDDVVVHEQGCEIITAAAPKAIVEVEALMRDGRA